MHQVCVLNYEFWKWSRAQNDWESMNEVTQKASWIHLEVNLFPTHASWNKEFQTFPSGPDRVGQWNSGAGIWVILCFSHHMKLSRERRGLATATWENEVPSETPDPIFTASKKSLFRTPAEKQAENHVKFIAHITGQRQGLFWACCCERHLKIRNVYF